MVLSFFQKREPKPGKVFFPFGSKKGTIFLGKQTRLVIISLVLCPNRGKKVIKIRTSSGVKYAIAPVYFQTMIFSGAIGLARKTARAQQLSKIRTFNVTLASTRLASMAWARVALLLWLRNLQNYFKSIEHSSDKVPVGLGLDFTVQQWWH